MQNKSIAGILLVYFIFFLNIPTFAQCEECTLGQTISTNIQSGGTEASPTEVIYNNFEGRRNNDGWDGARPSATSYARFENSGFYLWEVDGNNIVQIKGLILESGVTLKIERTNNNITPIFDVEGGCIIVKSGATLIFSYYTKMDDLKICVEGDGKVIFDSEPQGQSDGDRDKFVFNDIQIFIEPESEIKFGDAEIEQTGSILIEGYEGEACILLGDGNYLPPPPPQLPKQSNIIVEIPPMTQIELNLFCEFLSKGARITPQPVEYLYFNHTYDQANRILKLSWATAKEWENSHFEVERAVNRIIDWEKIGEVKGVGWSEIPVKYFFTDEMPPLMGGNVFYRLRQVDFNGEFAYSEVISVRLPPLQSTNGVWRVFPNPTAGDALRIELLDTNRYNGEPLKANLITPTAGRKSLNGNIAQTIAEEVLGLLNANGKGVYVLEISWGQRIEYIKLIKN